MGRGQGRAAGKPRRQTSFTWMVALLALAALGLLAPSMRRPASLPTAQIDELRARHERRLRDVIAAEALARSDGWVYAVDIAQLLSYAALRQDSPLYGALHAVAGRFLFVRPIQHGWPHTMVAWRIRPGDAPQPEASGTTEALELARALWLGAEKLARPGDRETALRVLEGYLRHQHEGTGPWIIRNYYDFIDDAFADDSFLVDYDPDFIMRVALSTGRKDLCQVAHRSRALVEQAATPAGLLRSIITPSLLTLMPMAIHSPNNVEKLANVASVAERGVGTNPRRAREVLDFALQRAAGLKLYYDADSGEPRDAAHAGLVTRATLVRLAVKLRRPAARDIFLADMVDTTAEQSHGPDRQPLYELGQVLLALELVRQQETGTGLPSALAPTTDVCQPN